MSRVPVTLHRIVFTDWQAAHSWAGRPDACRYQPWGPNTEDQPAIS